MKKMTIRILELMLRLWEDANIFGEFSFQSYLKIGISLGDFKSHPGSEISANGKYLYRSISNYKNLRILLEEGDDEPINYYAYLPRVPKSLRADIGDNRELFGRMIEMGGVLLFPKYISKWMLGKKLFSVTKEASIPLVPLTDENHLEHLPYDDFIIVMEEPFMAHFGDRPTNFTFKTLMVSKKEDEIHILIIPEEIENYNYNDEERVILERLTFLSMSKNINAFMREKKKAVRVLLDGKSASEELGYFIPESIFFAREIRVDIGSGGYSYRGSDIDDKDLVFDKDERYDATEDPGLVVTSYLNGLCKIISEMENTNGILLKSSTDLSPVGSSVPRKKSSPVEEEEELLVWNEVFEGQVLHVSSEITHNGVSHIIRGHEKSPHLRRGHFRKLVREDDSIKTVWVRNCSVRKDLLNRAGFTSGASVIKE